jgi:threonine dehydrogenase-like Zn-dependent dehydrogenase
LLLASYWEGLVLPSFVITLKEIRVVPSSLYDHRHATTDFEAAAEILAVNPDVADVLITHRLPLDDAVRAFEIAADRAAGAIKIVLEA